MRFYADDALVFSALTRCALKKMRTERGRKKTKRQ
jgi:hypothetical protein